MKSSPNSGFNFFQRNNEPFVIAYPQKVSFPDQIRHCISKRELLQAGPFPLELELQGVVGKISSVNR